jgi:hypothetical protein
MNCLQSRRLLLSSPRERSAAHQAHISTCERCANLALRLGDLDRSIENAALVPVPDALTHRILLRQGEPRTWRYAAAAAVALLSIGISLVAAEVVEAPGFPTTVQAVGPTHPAVIAIAEVVEDSGSLDRTTRNDAHMEHGLKRLGLSLKPGAAVAHIGACRIEGAAECEHIVLSTPEAYANVMLVPDYPLSDRVLVTDRRMVALVSPAARGGYIVVADSVKAAKSVEKLFVRGDPVQSAKSPKPVVDTLNRRG